MLSGLSFSLITGVNTPFRIIIQTLTLPLRFYRPKTMIDLLVKCCTILLLLLNLRMIHVLAILINKQSEPMKVIIGSAFVSTD